MSDYNLNRTGDVYSQSVDVEVIAWKIPKIHSIPIKVDNGVQSPSFSFANAIWNLKLFVHGETKSGSENKADVMIERVHCNTSVLFPISYEIFLTEYSENASLFEYTSKKYHHDTLGKPLLPAIRGFFEANHSQDNVVNVIPYAGFFDLVSSNPDSDAIVLICEFRKLHSGIRLICKSN